LRDHENKETSPGRVLGIDYGAKRIGVSLSDPLEIIASPLVTLENAAGVMDEIRNIIRRETVRLVIVGMPLNLKGQKGRKAVEVEDFCDRLRSEIDCAVLPWDERFTTTMAKRSMIAGGVRRNDRRAMEGRIDSTAAAILLQSYLDSKKNSRVC